MWRLWLPLHFLPQGRTARWSPQQICMNSTHCEWHHAEIPQHVTSSRHAAREDDKTFHMSICVITWGSGLWLIIFNGAKETTERIRACCWSKYGVLIFFSLALLVQQQPRAEDPKVLCNCLMQHVKIRIWFGWNMKPWTTGTTTK